MRFPTRGPRAVTIALNPHNINYGKKSFRDKINGKAMKSALKKELHLQVPRFVRQVCILTRSSQTAKTLLHYAFATLGCDFAAGSGRF